MRENKIKKALPNLDSKHLSYIDKETGNYIRIKCNLTGNISEVREFFSSIERMKLDAYTAGKKVLKSGKTTRDLVNEYKKLISADVIDFSNILALYEKDQLKGQVVLGPIIKFLELFDRVVEDSYSSLDIYNCLKSGTELLCNTSSYNRVRKELKSIGSNTEILNSQVIYNFATSSVKDNQEQDGFEKPKVKSVKARVGWLAVNLVNFPGKSNDSSKVRTKENRVCVALG